MPLRDCRSTNFYSRPYPFRSIEGAHLLCVMIFELEACIIIVHDKFRNCSLTYEVNISVIVLCEKCFITHKHASYYKCCRVVVVVIVLQSLKPLALNTLLKTLSS